MDFLMLLELKTKLKKNQDDKNLSLQNPSLATILVGIYRFAHAFIKISRRDCFQGTELTFAFNFRKSQPVPYQLFKFSSLLFYPIAQLF